MPDCPTGNYPARICSLEEAYTQIAAGIGHPPMEVTYTSGPFAFSEANQTLNIPIPPTYEVTTPSTVIFATDAVRLATTPGSMRQIGIQTTDAVSGNYSLWVPIGLFPGGWVLRCGSMGSQNKYSVQITGGVITGITDLAVLDGGTGASTATGARVNLANTTLAPVAGVIDWALSNHFVAAHSVDTTYTFANVADGLDISVVIQQIANVNVTFPSYVKWQGNAAPTHSAAGKTDIYSFERINGVVYGSTRLTYTT